MEKKFLNKIGQLMGMSDFDFFESDEDLEKKREDDQITDEEEAFLIGYNEADEEDEAWLDDKEFE